VRKRLSIALPIGPEGLALNFSACSIPNAAQKPITSDRMPVHELRQIATRMLKVGQLSLLLRTALVSAPSKVC
jgi:hypothetical protein